MKPNDYGSGAPFNDGQKVVAVDAVPTSRIKNGQIYTVRTCHYSYCKGAYYWYVDIVEIHDWLRPAIFAPLEEKFIAITLEKVLENETELISAN